MTARQVRYFAAAWRRCPLHLPRSIDMGAHGTIVDVPCYIGLQIARMDTDCERLRGLHEPQMAWIIKQIEEYQTHSTIHNLNTDTMTHTTTYTTTDFIAAIEREISKRRVTYPRIIAKKQKAGVTTEEIMDISTTQRIQYELLTEAVAAIMHVLDLHMNVAKAILDELDRELKMRQKCYKRWVYLKRMDPDVSASEIAVWTALVKWWNETYCAYQTTEA